MRVRLVKLYYADSDEEAKKRKRPRIYPNFFDIIALYQDDAGKWIEKAVLPVTRTGFSEVTKATPEAVVLDLHSKLIVEAGTGMEPIAPHAVTISFRKGVLTAK
jgi:hypothetical protein